MHLLIVIQVERLLFCWDIESEILEIFVTRTISNAIDEALEVRVLRLGIGDE